MGDKARNEQNCVLCRTTRPFRRRGTGAAGHAALSLPRSRQGPTSPEVQTCCAACALTAGRVLKAPFHSPLQALTTSTSRTRWCVPVATLGRGRRYLAYAEGTSFSPRARSRMRRFTSARRTYIPHGNTWLIGFPALGSTSTCLLRRRMLPRCGPNHLRHRRVKP